MPDAPPDNKQIKVVLVEDHPMFRERIAQLINKDLQMSVCGEADNNVDAMRIIQETKPDIAIVDITLTGSSGLELIKDMGSQGIETPVLVLSMHDELLYAERALRAGAKGYITKNQASSQVKLAIQTVLAGDVYLSPQMTNRVLRRMSKGSESKATGVAALTDRELEVFRLLGCGRNSREIAEEIGLGDATINSYRFRIREKLGIRNSAELYNQAAQWVKEHGG
jgi:DNA-binding NarL/FixJ family response regulator